MKYDSSAQCLAFAGERPELSAARRYTTFRRGLKWFDLFRNGVQRVVLLGPRGKPFGTARLHSAAAMPFAEISERHLDLNYGEFSNMQSAFDAMRDAYGPSFQAGELVTVLTFEVEP